MRFWWVNHKQTFAEEVGQGFLWSPKRNSNGARNQFYENMIEVEPGDVIFSYADARVQAVGVATSRAQTSPKPSAFGTTGDYWSDEGWYIPVNFERLQNPFRPKDYIDYLAPALPDKYSPINAQGNGNQVAYLSAVEGEFLQRLLRLIGDDFHNTLALAGGSASGLDAEAEAEQQRLTSRTDIGPTQIKQLVNARRGQGIFKTNVRGYEQRCRVTGLELQQHLVASHIKPWAKSTDQEKLDGANGLLLSPHVDHLFDKGYMSFEDNGQVVLSKRLQYRVLEAWHIDPDTNVGKFSREQNLYLEYHRDVILLEAS